MYKKTNKKTWVWGSYHTIFEDENGEFFVRWRNSDCVNDDVRKGKAVWEYHNVANFKFDIEIIEK